MEKSNFLNLNWKDVIKGLIVTFLTAFLTGALTAFQSGTVEFTWPFWEPTVYASITAGIAYLLKNWLTNSNDQVLTKEK